MFLDVDLKGSDLSLERRFEAVLEGADLGLDLRLNFVDIGLQFRELGVGGCGQSVVLAFDCASTGTESRRVTDLENVFVMVHSLDVVPGNECKMFVWGDGYTFVVAQDLFDHGWPPVGECTSFTDEGEVGGVGDAVRVDATVHLTAVEVRKALNLVGKFCIGGEGWDCRVEKQWFPEYTRELECESFR